jgi:hypothetical protein
VTAAKTQVLFCFNPSCAQPLNGWHLISAPYLFRPLSSYASGLLRSRSATRQAAQGGSIQRAAKYTLCVGLQLADALAGGCVFAVA